MHSEPLMMDQGHSMGREEKRMPVVPPLPMLMEVDGTEIQVPNEQGPNTLKHVEDEIMLTAPNQIIESISQSSKITVVADATTIETHKAMRARSHRSPGDMYGIESCMQTNNRNNQCLFRSSASCVLHDIYQKWTHTIGCALES